MAILNVTPDSFYDGGRYHRLDAALARAEALVEGGADLIDVGGESTRPGAAPVSDEEEIARVVPVIEHLAPRLPVPLSVDTSKPAVMRAAVAAGAGMINDVRALRLPGALETAAALGVPVCLMHMQGEPATMQQRPRYRDVVGEVLGFLQERVAAAVAAGLPRARLILDPGFGFGKTLAHNLALFAALPRFVATGLPVLVGVSRKSMLGQLAAARLGLAEAPPPEARLAASLGAAVLAATAGARLLRVHDPAETRQALLLYEALSELTPAGGTPVESASGTC